MALTQVTTSGLANGAVTSSKISNTVQLGGPTITQIQITDSSYNVLDDTAVSTSGGYIKITGTGFAAGAIVVIGSVNATSTGFVSSTVLNVQVPALSAGTYTVYVVNTNGGTAIGVNGLTYSAEPSWVTGSSLPGGTSGTPISIQLSATNATSYVLQAGSSLPSGLTLTSGGLLSGTVNIGIETVYSFTIVAIDAELQDSPRAFTITIIVGDPYFYLTTLLLPGNGTNNGTNNTFVDSSTNNFAITKNGSTAQGSFSPYSLTGWSIYQPAIISDFVSFTTSVGTSFQFSADFTIEMWVYPVAYSGSGDTSAWVISADGSTYLAFNYDSTNYNIYLNSGSPTSSFAHGIVTNEWNHIAMVRSGSTVTLYTNGISKGTTTNSSTLGYSNPVTNRCGGGVSGTSRYISNIRIVKGTAVYTANFTPPTTPLTAITNTVLLTMQSNRYIDNSTNAFSATVSGLPSIQSFSPFAPGSSYNASTIGGSMYSDGDGDFLSLNNNSAFLFGSGAFTIEYYAYVQAGGAFVSVWDDFSTNPQAWWMGAVNYGSTSTALRFTIDVSGTDTVVFDSNVNMPINQWAHYAVCRSGNTWYMFINGQQVATATNSSTISNGSAPLCIGGYSGASPSNKYAFKGYMSGLRILKGTALYTSAFTPPSTLPTNIANTSLLCNFINAQITDATSKNDLETVGDAKISTAQSKWGGSSMYFDGASDRLTIPFTNNFLELGVGGEKFTLEAWVYPTNAMASAGQMLSKGGGSASWSTSNGAQYQWTIYNSTASWNFNSSGSSIEVSSGTVTLNAWQHLAVTYDGTTTRTFLNGVLQSTSTSSYTAPTTRNLQYIGMTQSGGYTQEYYGYINDLRITKGYARYTTNFTPPTSAFPTL